MYDAIVVGARCAGSPTAMLLAQRGYTVLLVDRATFPSDIMSTHFIQPPGVGSLYRWGLAEAVLATNAPPISQMTMTINGQSTEIAFVRPDGRPGVGVCPRRILLDKILVDAAVAAGAELREQFIVEDLLRDQNGAVTGIAGRHGGSDVREEARIVIGADGLHSKVARLVEIEEYNRVESLVCGYYSYFSGVPSGMEIYGGPNAGSLFFPTNDGNTCIVAGRPVSYFDKFRKDAESAFFETLAVLGLEERVRAGKREERFLGAADLPHYFRKPYGPGWALIGDAGTHVDPTNGQGIMKAFIEVEMLVPSLDDGLSGRVPMEEALAAFHQRRDDFCVPIFQQNLMSATMQAGVPMPQVRTWAELRGQATATA
jgi:flavin-dependent dehydrogenase